MKRIVANILSVSMADIMIRLLGFLTTAYLARTLGPPEFGLMSIGLSLLGFLNLFASPGLHLMGTRDIAAGASDARRYAVTIVVTRLLLSCLLFAATTAVCVVAVADPLARDTIVVFALALFPMAGSLDWFFQGKERLGLVSASRVVLAFTYLLLVLLLVRASEDLVGSAAAFVVANLVAATVLLFSFLRANGMPVSFPDFSEFPEVLQRSFPLGLSLLLGQTITGLPVLVIGIFLTAAEAGAFNAALKIVVVVLLADRVLSAVFFPFISRLRREAEERSAQAVALILKLVTGLGVPIALLGVFHAQPVITLVYSSGYERATPAFQALFLYFLVTLMNSVMMAVLLGWNREKEYLRVMFWGTAAMVVLCFMLTAGFGITGTALSLGLGEMVMTVLYSRKVSSTPGVSVGRVTIPPLAAGSAMVGLLLFTGGLGPVVASLLGLAGYAVIFWSAGGITDEDVATMREIFA